MKNLLRSGILTLGLLSGVSATSATPLEQEQPGARGQRLNRDQPHTRRQARQSEREPSSYPQKDRRATTRTLPLKRIDAYGEL